MHQYSFVLAWPAFIPCVRPLTSQPKNTNKPWSICEQTSPLVNSIAFATGPEYRYRVNQGQHLNLRILAYIALRDSRRLTRGVGSPDRLCGEYPWGGTNRTDSRVMRLDTCLIGISYANLSTSLGTRGPN